MDSRGRELKVSREQRRRAKWSDRSTAAYHSCTTGCVEKGKRATSDLQAQTHVFHIQPNGAADSRFSPSINQHPSLIPLRRALDPLTSRLLDNLDPRTRANPTRTHRNNTAQLRHTPDASTRLDKHVPRTLPLSAHRLQRPQRPLHQPHVLHAGAAPAEPRARLDAVEARGGGESRRGHDLLRAQLRRLEDELEGRGQGGGGAQRAQVG